MHTTKTIVADNMFWYITCVVLTLYAGKRVDEESLMFCNLIDDVLLPINLTGCKRCERRLDYCDAVCAYSLCLWVSMQTFARSIV